MDKSDTHPNRLELDPSPGLVLVMYDKGTAENIVCIIPVARKMRDEYRVSGGA